VQIPNGLQEWLRNNGWEAIRIEPVVGGFAAKVYRFHACVNARANPRVKTTGQEDVKEEIHAVYKEFAPGRIEERHLYDRLLVHLPTYAPRVYGYVDTPGEVGIVLEDVGTPLKSVLSGLGRTEKEHLIRRAVTWLAEFHADVEENAQAWLRSDVISVYPMDSARAWGKAAIEALMWLTEQHLCEIDIEFLKELHDTVEWFYASLPAWMAGRMTLTHGDPHQENWMVHNGEFRLIDWEYACVAVPHRDLAIFLQDVLDEHLHVVARTTYWNCLRDRGWPVDDPQFLTSYAACLFDNTLMMLGWEVDKFKQGHLHRSELEALVPHKLRWLKQSLSDLC
jgi:hypothetical protein